MSLISGLARARAYGGGNARSIKGQLRGLGPSYGDETGPRNVRGCSLFVLLWLFKYDRAEGLRVLDLMQSAGHHFCRLFVAVGGYASYWGGREVVPITFTNDVGRRLERWPDYDENFRACLLAMKERGIGAYLTAGDMQIIAPRDDQWFTFVEQLADVINDVGPEAIFWFETCNEWWQNSGRSAARLKDIANHFHARCKGPLRTIGAGVGAEEPLGPGGLYKCAEGMDVVTVHNARERDMIERIFGVSYWDGNPRHLFHKFGVRILDGEPTGPNTSIQMPHGPGGVSVYAEQDPAYLLASMASALICGHAWTRFSGETITYRDYDRWPLGCTWGFKELNPIFDEALPDDIGQWPHLSHGNKPDTPIGAARFADKEPFIGPARVDMAYSSDRFACIVHGGHGDWNLQQRRGMNWRAYTFEGLAAQGSGPFPAWTAEMKAVLLAGEFK